MFEKQKSVIQAIINTINTVQLRVDQFAELYKLTACKNDLRRVKDELEQMQREMEKHANDNQQGKNVPDQVGGGTGTEQEADDGT